MDVSSCRCNICFLNGLRLLITKSGGITQPIYDSGDVSSFTHCGATHEDDYERAEDASNPDHPGHPQEEDHPKDVLDARQVHSHQSAQLWSLRNTNMKSGLCVLFVSRAHFTFHMNGFEMGVVICQECTLWFSLLKSIPPLFYSALYRLYSLQTQRDGNPVEKRTTSSLF